MDERLKDKVALVTGGGTGIGQAIAKLFAREGARVVVTARRHLPLIETVQELVDEHLIASWKPCDVARISDVQRLVEFTGETYGCVDVLVNCAGVVRRTEKVELTTDEEWDWQLDINLRGVFHTTKECLPVMMSRRSGVIVNIASTAAYFGSKGYATYCATKGGVVAYTRAVALQYAEYGIRANVVSPGMIKTPMCYVDRPNFDELVDGFVTEDYPIKRIGLPEDVANAALFLACDESSWITGQNLFVDGGFSIK